MTTKGKYVAAGLLGAGLVVSGAVFKIFSRVSIPKGATAVQPFRKEKYLGDWYEIARLDFKYEKGLSHVIASYSAKDTNTIHVKNRGYDSREHKWKESIGK